MLKVDKMEDSGRLGQTRPDKYLRVSALCINQGFVVIHSVDVCKRPGYMLQSSGLFFEL